MKSLLNVVRLAIFLAMAGMAAAAVPSAINYQGRLTDAAGIPQAGVRAMAVRIYDAAIVGTMLYSESVGNVAVDANGDCTRQTPHPPLFPPQPPFSLSSPLRRPQTPHPQSKFLAIKFLAINLAKPDP